ncbi:MAG: hypothetical protein V5783_02625 [Pontiella sp.]
MKRIVLIVISVSICLSTIFADEMPSEIKRLTFLKDKKVQEIDQKYWVELDKLKKKYVRSGSTGGALYIEKMQIDYIDSQNEKLEPAKASAVVKCEAQFTLFETDQLMFTNRSYKWTDVPRDFAGCFIPMAVGGAKTSLSFEVVESGIVIILSEPEDLMKFKQDGWKECGRAHRQPVKKDTISYILQKKLGKGEYRITTKSFLGVRLIKLSNRAKNRIEES